MRIFLTFSLFWALLAVVPGHAEDNPRTDYVFERIVTEFIVPGFGELAVAAGRHEAAWQAYCNAPSADGRRSLSDSFHALADRWAAIEMIRSGPAAEDFRHERFYFWPERKNAVERGLALLLKSPGAGALTAEGVAGESAAVQGLPALERLLFRNGTLDTELGQAGDGLIRCRVGVAIAGNAARLARNMHEGWRARADLVEAAAKAALATDLVTAFAVIKDVKIEAVIGKNAEEVKPRAAEFWRSGRTMRNIDLNLEALAQVNGILFEALAEEVSLPAVTRQARAIALSLSDDLASLAKGERRSEALLLRDAVDAAADRALIEVPAALGVTVGFNSLDGD